MKYMLFIFIFTGSLFQFSCKEDEEINANSPFKTLEEAQKHLETNRKYEMVKGCKVIAQGPANVMPFINFDPINKLFEDNDDYLTIPDDLVRSIVFEDVVAVKCLLGTSYDPNTRSISILSSAIPHSALHWAVSKNNPEIVKLLAEAGADVNERHEDGINYLLFFAEGEVKEILKAHGAIE